MKRERRSAGAGKAHHHPPGIVIRDRKQPAQGPAIVAFIWGGKVRPFPTLPFGRWKPKAA